MTPALRIACDRQARHAFWYWRYRCWRRELAIWSVFLLALALGFLIAIAAGLKASERQPQPATWNGLEWTCPSGSGIWVDETEARAGREPFAYCVTDSQP